MIYLSDFNKLKGLYEDGYRCIYYDNNTEGNTVYLKNFESEDSKTINLKDVNEFNQYKNYIDGLNNPS